MKHCIKSNQSVINIKKERIESNRNVQQKFTSYSCCTYFIMILNPYQSIFFVPNLPSFQNINFTKFFNLCRGIFVSNLKSFQHAEKTDQTFFLKQVYQSMRTNETMQDIEWAPHYTTPLSAPHPFLRNWFSAWGCHWETPTARGYGFQITFSVQAVDYSHFKSVREDTFNVCLVGFSQSCCLLLVNLKLIWLTIK